MATAQGHSSSDNHSVWKVWRPFDIPKDTGFHGFQTPSTMNDTPGTNYEREPSSQGAKRPLDALGRGLGLGLKSRVRLPSGRRNFHGYRYGQGGTRSVVSTAIWVPPTLPSDDLRPCLSKPQAPKVTQVTEAAPSSAPKTSEREEMTIDFTQGELDSVDPSRWVAAVLVEPPTPPPTQPTQRSDIKLKNRFLQRYQHESYSPVDLDRVQTLVALLQIQPKVPVPNIVLGTVGSVAMGSETGLEGTGGAGSSDGGPTRAIDRWKFKCGNCLSKFRSESHRDKHWRTTCTALKTSGSGSRKKARPRHPCDHCALTFSSRKKLVFHQQLVELTKEMEQCEVCTEQLAGCGRNGKGQKFRLLHRVLNKERDVGGTHYGTIMCLRCGLLFRQTKAFRRQMSHVHSVGDFRATCPRFFH